MTAEAGSPDTRRLILDVALREFAARGYAGTRLTRIAEAAGLRKTALYYYYEGKAALYAAALEHMLADFERTITRATARGEPSAAGLSRLLDDLNDLLGERRSYSRILIRIFVDRVDFDRSALGPRVQRIVESFLRYHRAGVESGVFRKLSARHFFQSVVGAVVFHYAAADFSRAVLSVDDVFARSALAWRRDELRRLVLRGALAEGPGEPESGGRSGE